MKISFVIPAHNEENRIGACIESINLEIDRSGCDAEIIIGNNASTDRTKEVALKYPRTRVVDEPHKGTNFARQAGFVAATGELVANIDADCMLPPGWITTALKEFERDLKLVGLGGPYIYYDLPFFSRMVMGTFQFGMYVAYLVNRFVLRSASQLLGGNCIMRREALQKIGGYDTSFTFFGDDNDTANRLMKVGKVKFTYHLPIYSSGRRQVHEGMFKVGWRYMTAFFATNYGVGAVRETSTDVRVPVEKH